jgi:serine/threonine protein kinase
LFCCLRVLQGTPTHMAPELLLHGHVSKASDVYAFGILLWEMLVGARPYGSIPLPLLPHEVARAGRRPEWPPELLADKDLERCRALAEACWGADPAARWVQPPQWGCHLLRQPAVLCGLPSGMLTVHLWSLHQLGHVRRASCAW